MEPYNPEKSWLEFKFNKDQVKEQLKQTIPGLRALMYMHENPESSALETLDLAAEDFVPFYSAIKYGAEPSDFAKEAFLMGIPMYASTKSKLSKEVKKNPNREYFNYNGDLYYKAKIRNKDKYVNAYDKSDKIDVYDYYDNFEGPNTGAYKYNDYKEVLNDIDATNKLHDRLYSLPPLDDNGVQPPSLAQRSRDLLNNSFAIERADLYLQSHNIGNKDIYTNHYGNVIVADPVNKTAMEYDSWGPNNNPIWSSSGKPFNYNDLFQRGITKVDNNLRMNTSLESKLLNSEAKKLNIEMNFNNVDYRYPYLKSGEYIFELPSLNNRMYVEP